MKSLNVCWRHNYKIDLNTENFRHAQALQNPRRDTIERFPVRHYDVSGLDYGQGTRATLFSCTSTLERCLPYNTVSTSVLSCRSEA